MENVVEIALKEVKARNIVPRFKLVASKDYNLVFVKDFLEIGLATGTNRATKRGLLWSVCSKRSFSLLVFRDGL